MDDAQLQQEAEKLGIKKASTLPREEIVNQILDLQAEQKAKDFVSKTSDKKKPAKESKEKKQKKQSQPEEINNTSEDSVSSTNVVDEDLFASE